MEQGNTPVSAPCFGHCSLEQASRMMLSRTGCRGLRGGGAAQLRGMARGARLEGALPATLAIGVACGLLDGLTVVPEVGATPIRGEGSTCMRSFDRSRTTARRSGALQAADVSGGHSYVRNTRVAKAARHNEAP